MVELRYPVIVGAMKRDCFGAKSIPSKIRRLDMSEYMEKHSVDFKNTAKDWVAEKGYDPVFGARPLKRFLQRHIETKLARSLIAGEVGEGSAITFTVRNGGSAR